MMEGTDPMATGRPLAGLRVLDMAHGALSAIGRLFCDLGADVVRLEPQGGAADRREGLVVGEVSLDFIAGNAGKRAATLDRLPALAAETDILIEARSGADVAALRARNPALVVLSVSDFGEVGPWRDWVGSGAVFHALSGELSRSGMPGRAPLLPPGELAIACAAVQAIYVTLLAYYEALRTGQGDRLDFALLDGAAQALDPGYGIAGSATNGVPASQLPRGRPDARHQYPIVPCKDGFVRLCVLAPRQWRGMFEWMGRPEAFADPSFDKLQVRFESQTLVPAIAALFATKTKCEIEAEGQRFGVPTGAVLDASEALATDQMTARVAVTWLEVAPGLRAPFPDGAIEVDGDRMGLRGPAPDVPDSRITWAERERPDPPERRGDRPLSGLKVLDLGVIVVGAEGGRLLADQGADVIKVESSAFPDGARQSRGGGPISPTFATGHRNKRSLGVNLRDPRGKALLLDLVAQSDVLLSNFKGGVLASLGLTYDALRSVNPRIVVTDSSAFGPTGPWSERMGYGPLVRASAGLTASWRYAGDPDSFSDTITVYPDHVAGRLVAIGVLALLIRRLRTGRGGQVSVSQAEIILGHMTARVAADSLERDGHRISGQAPRSAVHACAGDDEWCAVTLRGASDEAAIHGVTGGRPLADWLAGQPPRAAMTALQEAGVPAGAMLRVSDLPACEHYRARGFFRQETNPYLPDPFTVEAAPVRSERLADPPDRPAPALGQHTVELVQQRLGLPVTEVEALAKAGVLDVFQQVPA